MTRALTLALLLPFAAAFAATAEPRCSTDSRELFVYIEEGYNSTVTVTATNIVNSADTTSWQFSRANPHSSAYDGCQWSANTDDSGGGGVTFIRQNVLWLIEITATDVDQSFLYMNYEEEPADSNWSVSDTFYGPFQHAISNIKNDLWIIITSSSSVRYEADGWLVGDGYEYINDVGLSDNMLWPHDIAAYCDGVESSKQADCRSGTKRAGYFWTKQVGGPPFTHLNDDWDILAAHLLEIDAANSLSMPSGTAISVYGTFDVTGMTFGGVSAGTWAGIEFKSGSTGTLDDVTISDVSAGYGAVRIYSASPTIDSTIIDAGSGTGIYVSGATSNPFIEYSAISGTGDGVRFASSGGGNLWHNTIDVDGAAVAAEYFADPYLHSYPGRAGGYNDLNGGLSSIEAWYGGTVYAGTSSYYGNNDLCGGGGGHTAFAYQASIDARRNYWTSPQDAFEAYGGSIDSTLSLGTSTCTALKRGDSSYGSPFVEAGERPSAKLQRAFDLVAGAHRANGEYDLVQGGEAARLFKEVQAESPGGPDARTALVGLFRLGRFMRSSEHRPYFEALASDRGPDQATALGLLVPGYLVWGDTLAARGAAQMLKSQFGETWHGFYASMAMFDLDYGVGRYSDAWATLRDAEARNDFEAERLAYAWDALSRKVDDRTQPEPRPRFSGTADDSSLAADAVTAYPNPFNPTITIRTVLPDDDNVDIAVFDVLGRKVSTLASGHLEAGTHQFMLNGAGMVSGTYFVVVRTGQSTQTLPIVLTK